MFQDYALFPHLTVVENVTFGLRDLPPTAAQASARQALARVGLEGKAGLYPDTLSGGEQQRVALARSIAPRPGVLLMDEPFSNLDRRLRDAIREETIAILREMGATTIVVTHDPEEAMRIADRIVLMRAGRIVQDGDAENHLPPPGRPIRRPFLQRFQRDGRLSPGRRGGHAAWRFPGAGLARGASRARLRAAARRAADAGRVVPSGPHRVAALPRRHRSPARGGAGPRRAPPVPQRGTSSKPRWDKMSGSTSARRKSLFSPQPNRSFRDEIGW